MHKLWTNEQDKTPDLYHTHTQTHTYSLSPKYTTYIQTQTMEFWGNPNDIMSIDLRQTLSLSI